MNKIIHIVKSKKSYFLILGLVLLLFFVRLIFLDGDIPPNSLLDYQPVDEGIYGNLALNTINFNSINPNSYFGVDFINMSGQVILNFIGNIFIMIGLFVFGDNYFGFRIPIVITTLITFIIIYAIFIEIEKKYNFKNHNLKIIFMFLLVSNFIIYNASRTVEPTIFRMLFVCLICYLFIKLSDKNKLRSFIIGLLTSISMFLVYITNSFLCISFILFIIYLFYMKEFKKARECLLFGIIGIGIGCFISQIYYMYWGTDFLTNTIMIMNDFQYNTMYAISNINFLIFFNRVISFFTSNLFIYCTPFLIGLFIFLKQILCFFKEKNETIIFSTLTIFSLFIQTLVTEDFINRKIIVLLPVFCMLFYELFIYYRIEGKINTLKSINLLTILVIILCFIKKFFFGNIGYTQYNSTDILISFLFFLLPSIIIIIILIYPKIYNINNAVIIYFLLICFGNSLFIYRYNFKHINFGEKEAMISLREFDDEIILGEYENGFTLYNNFIPLLESREKTYELMKSGKYKFYFDYANVDGYLNTTFPNIKFEKYKIIKRQFPNQYGNNDMCVYKIKYEED